MDDVNSQPLFEMSLNDDFGLLSMIEATGLEGTRQTESEPN